MNLRRALALGAAGLAAAAVLSACGFNYPTDRINNLTAGVDDRTGTVEVLNAVVVAKEANSGTFVATLVNNSPTQPVRLESASGDNTAISTADATPFTLQPNGLRNLADGKGGIPVSGTFALGQFVSISLTFDNGQTSDLQVPVVADSGQWAGLDTMPTPTPTPTPPATASPSGSPTSSPSGSPSASPSS